MEGYSSIQSCVVSVYSSHHMRWLTCPCGSSERWGDCDSGPASACQKAGGQTGKIKAVFTQWAAITQKTFNAYNNFLLQSLTAKMLIWKTTCCGYMAEELCVLTCEDRVNSVSFKNSFPLISVISTVICLFILCGTTSDFKPDGITTLSLVWRVIRPVLAFAFLLLQYHFQCRSWNL